MEVERGAAVVDRHLPPLARLLVVAEALHALMCLSGSLWLFARTGLQCRVWLWACNSPANQPLAESRRAWCAKSR